MILGLYLTIYKLILNTSVVILNAEVMVLMNTTNYQNNCEDNWIFKSVNPIYYYIITTRNNTIKRVPSQ
jgi:hypothetical protein